MSYYGVIFPEFWTGQTGRAIRERGGKDAQIVALYFATNRQANMLGLYHLPSRDITHETGLSAKALERSLRVLDDVSFASFDAATAFVWVRTMARFKLGLQAGDTLQSADNRVVAANRLYHNLGLNPFLGPFYDAHHKLLCLRKRRQTDTPVVVFTATTHNMSPLRGASKGLVSQDQDQDQRSVTGSGSGISNRDQQQGSATERTGALSAAPDPNGARPSVRNDQGQPRRVAADARAAHGASAPVVRGNGKSHDDDHPLVTKYFGKGAKA